MNSDEILTSTEQYILKETRKLLGDNLADLLLSGLGETSITQRRVFTAQSSPSLSGEVTYQFEMINDSEQGLPIGYDPLVMASLLGFLWERQPLDSTILFRRSDILEKLEWDDDVESRSLIKRALERYALTAYCLVDPASNEEGHPSGRFVCIGRLLTGYEMASPLYPLMRKGQLKYAVSEQLFACAHFLPGIIQDVISQRKNFLGIDFQKLDVLSQQRR